MNSGRRKGLGLIYISTATAKGGPIAKNIGEDRTEALRATSGSVMAMPCFSLLACRRTAYFAGQARTQVGDALELVDENKFEFCWVVDYPMYELDENTGKIEFSHNRSQCHKVDWKRWKPGIPSIS